MLSKKELLRKIVGINCSINVSNKGIHIFIKDKSKDTEKIITGVGEDLFEVTKCYGKKKQKIYYNIDSVVIIEGYVIEVGL